MNRFSAPAGFVAAIVVLALTPFFVTTFAVSTLTQILSFSLLAASVSLLMGQGGMPTLGQAAYLGVGGYAAGLLAIHVTTDALLGLLVAAVAGLVASLLTGWLVVRGRGTYLLMLTLAIAQLLAQVANSWVSVTNGSDGLIGVPHQTLFGASLASTVGSFWFVLAVFALCMAGLALLIQSPFGHTLRGIRDNETRMRALGYGTVGYKLAAFGIAGVVSAVAGSLTITETQYMAPSEMNYIASSIALIASIAGGTTRLWGAVLGSALVVACQVLLPEAWQGKGPLVLGVVLILVVYLVPGGFAGALSRVVARIRPRARREGTRHVAKA